MSIPPYLNFVKRNKENHEQNEDDLKTVEEVWDANFLYKDITISKKGDNSRTSVTKLTKQMSSTFTIHR